MNREFIYLGTCTRSHRLMLNRNHAIFRGQPRTTQCMHVCQTLFRRLRGVVYETTQVVLSAYVIAPVKIHAELEKIHVTCGFHCIIFNTLAESSKKRERRQVN